MRHHQRGQILPIFALSAVVIVGIIALGIDYGFLADQHRNLQAVADAAAEAGAEQLSIAPTQAERTAARQAAFIYLRDNLQLGVTTASATCAGVPIDFGSDVSGCKLGASGTATNYTISITTPAQPPRVLLPRQSWTVRVVIYEAVTTSLANVLALAGPVQAGAAATALFDHNQHFPFALYVERCLTTGTHLEIIGGDVGINSGAGGSCTPSATLCAEQSPGGGGNIIFGARTTDPLVVLPNSSYATCTSGAANQVLATGAIQHTTISPPPGFAPPPAVAGSTSFPVPAPCFVTISCPNATATAPCLNGSTGNSGNLCFSPGTYGTLGPVTNNLNPGVYYVAGPSLSSGDACYPPPGPPPAIAPPPCRGVWFTGNTVNANWQDIYHQCWKNPNNPPAWSFSTPRCPDGFVFDPTAPSDPECTPITPLPAPDIPFVTLAPNPTGGNLAAGTFYLRISATNALGETDTIEQKVTVTTPITPNTGSITVTGAPMPGAVNYLIYGPSTTPNQELPYPSTNGTGGSLSASTASTLTLTDVAVGYPTLNKTGSPGLAPPAFTTSGQANGATPPNGLTGKPTTFYVRVSALNGNGETTTTEVPATVPGNSGQGLINLTINTVPGATSYAVYGPATAPNGEVAYGSIAQPPTPLPPTVSFTLDHLPSIGSYPPVNTTGNTPLPDPAVSMSAGPAGGTLASGTTYYVKVTTLNSRGESLGTEQSISATSSGTISVNVSRVGGATGYQVYGPSTASGTEVGYSAAVPTVAQPATGNPAAVVLDHVPPAGNRPLPMVSNTTGCPAKGFHNIPNNYTQNYGVTIVLGNQASFCLNVDCSGTATGGTPPMVLLSPACYSGFSYTNTVNRPDQYDCQAPASGPLQNDGAFNVYASSNGTIEAQNGGGPWEMSGTLYAPKTSLLLGPGIGAIAPQFGLIPGQLIVGSASIQTGNLLNPLAWTTDQVGAPLPIQVRLIE